jgi:RNA polymerase sigma-70 factor (ECF subfamily)
VLGYLAVLLRDEDDARDVFSAFGEELWRSLSRFERRSSAKTWAYAIAYRCALRHRRERARQRMRPIRDSEYSKLAAGVRSVSRSTSRSAADRQLDALRAALDDEEQTLLVLRIDRRMAWGEIAKVLGAEATTAPALRKRFQRLKQRLRKLVDASK